MGLWFSPMNPEQSKPIKTSFSLYESDKNILEDLVVGLCREGVQVRAGTVLRALAYLNDETEMFAAAVMLDRDLKAKSGGGPLEAGNWSSPPPTADLPKSDRDKMRKAGIELRAKGHPHTHSFIMRALLRSAPEVKTFVPMVRKFLEKVPRRPRTPKAHGRS
jgi:hypothetical protein